MRPPLSIHRRDGDPARESDAAVKLICAALLLALVALAVRIATLV